ncbi:hypothetical protein NL533_30820, partial [Klebsiella pneumoniae]|nr:hypothetical protein [Klebsiella pneumoniae]
QFNILVFPLPLHYSKVEETKEETNFNKNSNAQTTFSSLQGLAKQLGSKKDAYGKIPSPVRRELARVSDIYRYLFRYLHFQHKAQLMSHAWL